MNESKTAFKENKYSEETNPCIAYVNNIATEMGISISEIFGSVFRENYIAGSDLSMYLYSEEYIAKYGVRKGETHRKFRSGTKVSGSGSSAIMENMME